MVTAGDAWRIGVALAGLAALGAPPAVGTPPLTERLPAAATVVGGFDVAAVTGGSAVDLDRWAAQGLVRLHVQALRQLEAAGVPARTGLRHVSFARIGVPEVVGLVACGEGVLDPAAIEAECIAQGAVPETLGVVPALRLPAGASGGPTLYLSFSGGREVLVAPRAATLAFHLTPLGLPSPFADLALVPPDAVLWLAGEASAVALELVTPDVPILDGIDEVVGWGTGPGMALRLVARARDAGGASLVAGLWRGLADLASVVVPSLPALSPLLTMTVEAEDARVVATMQASDADIDAIEELLTPLRVGFQPPPGVGPSPPGHRPGHARRHRPGAGRQGGLP
jgi:hypothetical protein